MEPPKGTRQFVLDTIDKLSIMGGMDSFRGVIEKWPSPAALAGDLGENTDAVRKWHTRDRIPAEKWSALIEAAKKRRIRINIQFLASLSSRRGRAKPAPKAA